MDKEYFASGRHIHDELCKRCLPAVNSLYDAWRTDKRIHTSLLLWPSESVRNQHGDPFSGVIFHAIDGSVGTRVAEVTRAAKACDAYALLLVEQLDDAVRAIFESEHGTRTWRLPIKNHGDVQVLGRPIVRDNAESIGVRWTAN